MSFFIISSCKDLTHGHNDNYFKSLKEEKRDRVLNVHVIPHTHDDVGWLKTPDQYYTGDRNDIQRAGVQYILNGIYDVLMKDPTKKFTYVEMAFFQKWWLEQSDEVKKNVKMLVDQKRLQFVNAGWSMSDEASVHYEDFINNMKAGHDFLKTELGYRPTIGWHIDPFGHHSASAALFAEMGFNAWFFGRMDHEDKARRVDAKELEFLWRPFNESLGARAEIFTHMMYNHYSAPPTFCMDDLCAYPPIVDDKRLENYNIEERAQTLHDYIIHQADHFRHDHVLLPFGDDFNYMNAQLYFFNLDKLIKYVNEHYKDVNLFYSTPYEYVDALYKLDIKWPTKYDDLFPYSDCSDCYWTGYFTSRATLKGYVREASRDFNSQSIFLALDYLINGKQTFTAFEGLFNQMGVLQHHDAVAGTEQQHVAYNYAKTLSEALTDERKQFLESYARVTESSIEDPALCKAHNSTYLDCPTKALDDPSVTEMYLEIVNESNERKTIAKIPIPHDKVVLLDHNRKEVETDIICANGSRDCHMHIPMEIPMWIREEFILQKISTGRALQPMKGGLLKGKGYSMEVESINGDVKLLIEKDGSQPEAVIMNYLYYKSWQTRTFQRSGAYIFRPDVADAKPERYNSFYNFGGYKGKFVSQIRLYGSEVNTTITGNIYTDFVEIETNLFGIPLSDQGQEVILHLSFDRIQNNGVFYTDSMGLEMQKRILNFRPTWTLNVTQPVTGNYYPVGHGVTIMDDKMTLEVLNDRSQGATSLQNGTLEFMIQRRTFREDDRGVDEPLNETDPTRTDGKGLGVIAKHYLRFYNNTVSHKITENSRWMQREIDTPLIYVFGTKKSSKTRSSNLFNSLSSGIQLPDNIKAVFHPQSDGSLFVRLENILDLFSANQTSTINVVDIAQFISEHTNNVLESVTEVSNSGLYTMEEMKQVKLKWQGIDFITPEPDYSTDPSKTELSPQRIRSFVIKFSKRTEQNLVSY